MHNQNKIIIKLKNSLPSYLMLLPAFVLILMFVLIPAFNAVRLSFYNVFFDNSKEFVGLQHYKALFANSEFAMSLWVGIKFVLLIVPLQFVLSILIALLIRKIPIGKGLVKSVVYIPYMISGVAVAMIFTTFFYLDGGIFNHLLYLFGGTKNIDWMNKYPVFCIVLPAVWMGFGYTTLVLLAAMNDVSQSYYEAADLEGANAFVKFFSITLPLIKNTTIYLSIVTVVANMQLFDLPYVLTGGGPVGATTTPNVLIFKRFFSDYTPGYSMAASVTMLVLLGTISLFIFRLFRSEKSLED